MHTAHPLLPLDAGGVSRVALLALFWNEIVLWLALEDADLDFLGTVISDRSRVQTKLFERLIMK